MSDQDFEKLLEEFRGLQPSDDQIKRWQFKVNNEANLLKRAMPKEWMRLAAALFIGFVIGASIFGFESGNTEEKTKRQRIKSATPEYIFTKTY